MSTTDTTSWSGRTVGAYKVLLEIGRGRSGVVYLAEETPTQKKVALKVYAAGPYGESALVAAKTLQNAQHEGLARVHACGREDYRVWVVSEYVLFEPPRAAASANQVAFAKNLSEYMSEHAGLLDERAVAELLLNLCDALLHVHAHTTLGYGGIHPHNVLVQRDEHGAVRALLTDIGVSGGRLRRSAADAYLSPEELQGQPATAPSDMYGLGALAYFLLTSVAPPSPLVEPSRIRQTCDPGWDALVRRALKYEPERRHRSYQDFRAEVAEILARVKKPFWRKCMRVVYFTNMFIGLVILAGALTGIIYYLRSERLATNAPPPDMIGEMTQSPAPLLEPPALPQSSMLTLDAGSSTVAQADLPGATSNDLLDTSSAVAIGTPDSPAGQTSPPPAVAPAPAAEPVVPVAAAERVVPAPTAAPVAAAEPTDAPTEAAQVYVVKSHDTLWRIAKQHGMSVAALLALNGLAENAVIHAGQQLQVHGTAGTPSQPAPAATPAASVPAAAAAPAAPAPTQYKVQPGDTYYSIARKFKCAVQELQGINTNQALRFDHVILVPGVQPHE
ncbi:MAG: LysM peptidoglycan-binding domain-containing protein [bacterium]|nr:LysM peptidoglycan-binding domain-containing protein [bacterium]